MLQKEMDAMEGAAVKFVDDNELLYRGVIVEQWITRDQTTNKHRLSSAAFNDSTGQVSVDVSSKTTPQESLQRLEKCKALASIIAKEPKYLGCDVVEDAKEDNPAHALIIVGKSSFGRSRRKSIAKELAKKCQWVIPPDGFDMLEPVVRQIS